MEKTVTTEDVFNLGTRLGRKQAFGVIAGRCTAAEIECLIEARENKLYLAVDSTWEGYCKNRLGISRFTAERIIRQYQKLGPNFSKLNSFTRITPSEYCLIAAAVTDEGLAYDDEIIPMDPDNAARLADAVDTLVQEATPEAPAIDPAEQAFSKAAKSLQLALAEFARLLQMDLDEDGRLRLLVAVEAGQADLDNIRRATVL